MIAREVHWHDGMFLRPHHYQALQRHLAERASRDQHWDHHYNWGLRTVEIDTDALANYRLVIRRLDARWHDGTTLSVPDDSELAVIDLKPAFAEGRDITVYLAIASLHLGRPNITDNGRLDTRFKVDTQDLEDENTGLNPRPVSVRRLNARILLSGQDQTGYEIIPIARLTKSALSDGTPVLDQTFIPPLLATDAWKPLSDNILESICDRIGKKLELLSNLASTRGIGFGSNATGDSLILEQLRALNEVQAPLSVLIGAEKRHPLTMFVELSRIVGRLAIFDQGRQCPKLPRYDHDDLGGCFYRMKQIIDGLLDLVVEPEYKERPFIGAGLRMQVTLEPAWLESGSRMYIGVRSDLDDEECIRLVTKAGELDMKVGSSDRVDSIFRLGEAGLTFTHAPHPPRVLPAHAGLIYFEINREARDLEWRNVEQSLTLAIRLNENLIAGNIQGERLLRVKTAQSTTSLEFSLYVVPRNVT